MKTNNVSSTGFNGAFIINFNNSKIKESIPNILRKGKQVFYDIKTPGDVVLVTKDKYDKRVGEFIHSNNLGFEYYPEISTSCGLDDQIPSVLKKMLDIKNNCVIKDWNLLNKFFVNTKLHLSSQGKYLKEAMDTLRLNVGKSKVEIDSKGHFVVRDIEKERTIFSTGFKDGMSYICVVPNSLNQETKRFLVGQNGKNIIKEFNTPKDIADFNKAFKKTVSSILEDK